MGISKAIKAKNWWKGYKKYLAGSKEEPRRPDLPQRLETFLKKERVPYRLIPHSEVFTAPELAASIHATGRRVAKVLVVWAKKQYFIGVLPAHRHLDLARFARLIGARKAELAGESEISRLFPDCELGAMPPFGHLYGLTTYVDESLAHESEIFFQAGSHHEVIEMQYRDFERIAHARLGALGDERSKRASGF